MVAEDRQLLRSRTFTLLRNTEFSDKKVSSSNSTIVLLLLLQNLIIHVHEPQKLQKMIHNSAGADAYGVAGLASSPVNFSARLLGTVRVGGVVLKLCRPPS